MRWRRSADRSTGRGVDEPLFDVRPGWPIALTALAVAGLTTVLSVRWAVSIDWLAIRLAIGGLLALTAGLAVGSNSLIGLASLPALAGPTLGLDRPTGHAWGQVLLISVLWYAATELAWAAVEARDETRRSPDVLRLRVREVTTVIAVSVVIGVGASVLASSAPVRTALVRAAALAAVLAAVVVLGRHLAARTRPDDTAAERTR